jgi:hypothetical protein
MKWKVAMPKEKPDTGKAHFVLSVKYGSGTRLEFAGQVTVESAARMMKEASFPTQKARSS